MSPRQICCSAIATRLATPLMIGQSERVGLAVPRLLTDMIATGRWPADAATASRQNVNSWVSTERVRALVPTGEPWELFLYSPPFATVAELVREGDVFWDRPSSDPDGLDREKALVIGDFGLGSDAPIVLDYRDNEVVPVVRYLQWTDQADEEVSSPSFGSSNAWVLLAPSFELFVQSLAL